MVTVLPPTKCEGGYKLIAVLIVETHIYSVKGMLQTFFLNLLFTKF